MEAGRTLAVTIGRVVVPVLVLIMLSVTGVAVVLGFLVRYLTRHDLLAYIVGAVLVAAILAAYFLSENRLEGLLPRIMTRLSLFQQFDVFVNGIFDMTAIVYFLSVSVFFLFLSVQSLEKRRYN